MDALEARQTTAVPADAHPDLPIMHSKRSALAELSTRIDRLLCENRPERGRCLAEMLTEYSGQPDLLDGLDLQSSPESYSRRLICSGADFTLLAIVWLPMQMSPVHSHRTWCALAVHQGCMTETRFQRARRRVRSIGERQLLPGDTSYTEADPDAAHRMANLGEEPAVSLHVYGAAFDRLGQDVNQVWLCAT